MPGKRWSVQSGWNAVKCVPLKPNVCVSIIPCDNCFPWHIQWDSGIREQVQLARDQCDLLVSFFGSRLKSRCQVSPFVPGYAPYSVLATHSKLTGWRTLYREATLLGSGKHHPHPQIHPLPHLEKKQRLPQLGRVQEGAHLQSATLGYSQKVVDMSPSYAISLGC